MCETTLASGAGAFSLAEGTETELLKSHGYKVRVVQSSSGADLVLPSPH